MASFPVLFLREDCIDAFSSRNERWCMERESDAEVWWIPDFQVPITHRMPDELWLLTGPEVTSPDRGEERHALPRRGPLLQGRLSTRCQHVPPVLLVEKPYDWREGVRCQVWQRLWASWPALKHPCSKEENSRGYTHP